MERKTWRFLNEFKGSENMAIPTSIKTLLSGSVVEWARIEFKGTWDPQASLKSVCAFANDLDNWGGGYIVIGVEEDNGRPVYPLKGVPIDRIDSYQKDIYAKCKLIRPAYTPIIEVADYQDKNSLSFGVQAATAGHIHPLKPWQRTTKNVFTIFVSLPILWSFQMMKKKICLIWQTGCLLMTG